MEFDLNLKFKSHGCYIKQQNSSWTKILQTLRKQIHKSNPILHSQTQLKLQKGSNGVLPIPEAPPVTRADRPGLSSILCWCDWQHYYQNQIEREKSSHFFVFVFVQAATRQIYCFFVLETDGEVLSLCENFIYRKKEEIGKGSALSHFYRFVVGRPSGRVVDYLFTISRYPHTSKSHPNDKS